MFFLVAFGLLLIFFYSFFLNGGIVILAQEVKEPNNSSSGMPYLKDPSLKVEKILGDLNMPTNMAFIKDNDFLILEKNGAIKRVVNGITSEEPLLKVNVSNGFFQGLLGIAVSNTNINNNNISNSTNISQSPLFVFLFYTEDKGDGSTPLGNRLYRYELVNDQLINPQLLLDLPAIPNSWGNGGAITIGPDNDLYVTIGSVGTDKYVPQTMTLNYRNSTAIDGRAGILHITQDGQPVGEGILGNTYPLNLYYAYGIENSYGIDFDPLTNNLWDVENDGSHNDELNIVKPGFNSGYGMITGMSVESPAVPSALVNFSGNGIYKDPEFVWFKKPVVTGLKFLPSDKLGKTYQNQLFVGGFLDGRIYNFSLNSDRTHLELPPSLSSRTIASSDLPIASTIIFGQGFGQISNLVVGPDGYLYIVSIGSGSIYKITRSQ
jgi:glucose/arabinose dehydrogenase